MFSAQKPKSSRRFLEIDPDILHTCYVSSCRPVNKLFFFFCSPGIRDSLRLKYLPKNKRQIYLAEKKQVETWCTEELTGARRTPVQNFRIHLPKNGVNFHLFQKTWVSARFRAYRITFWLLCHLSTCSRPKTGLLLFLSPFLPVCSAGPAVTIVKSELDYFCPHIAPCQDWSILLVVTAGSKACYALAGFPRPSCSSVLCE